MTASQQYSAPDVLPHVSYHYLAQQCTLTHYSRAGVRHSLSVAELILRSLELADAPDLKREITATLCTEVYVPKQPQAMMLGYPAVMGHASFGIAPDSLAAAYGALRDAVRDQLRHYFRLDDASEEVQAAAIERIEIAAKLWFDEERMPRVQRKRDDEEWYRPYFGMDRDEAYLSLVGALERVQHGVHDAG